MIPSSGNQIDSVEEAKSMVQQNCAERKSGSERSVNHTRKIHIISGVHEDHTLDLW